MFTAERYALLMLVDSRRRVPCKPGLADLFGTLFGFFTSTIFPNAALLLLAVEELVDVGWIPHGMTTSVTIRVANDGGYGMFYAMLEKDFKGVEIGKQSVIPFHVRLFATTSELRCREAL